MRIGGWCRHRDLRAAPMIGARHRDRLGERLRALPAHDARDVALSAPTTITLPHVLAAALAPVPHEERVRAVVRVAAVRYIST